MLSAMTLEKRLKLNWLLDILSDLITISLELQGSCLFARKPQFLLLRPALREKTNVKKRKMFSHSIPLYSLHLTSDCLHSNSLFYLHNAQMNICWCFFWFAIHLNYCICPTFSVKKYCFENKTVANTVENLI